MKKTWKKNNSAKDQSRLTFLEGYLCNEKHLKALIGITGSSYDFTSLTPQAKTNYLQMLTKNVHRGIKDIDAYNKARLFSAVINFESTVLVYILSQTILRFTKKIQRIFVLKFYHDRKGINFLIGLAYVGEKTEIDEERFNEPPILGRTLYEYKVNQSEEKLKRKPTISYNSKNLDWPFPEKFYESIGFTVHVFSFEFKNATSNLKSNLNPQNDLINVESGIEQAENSLNESLFHSNKKNIEEKIAEYIAIPTKTFINKSYYLYDKSNLIKKHLLLPLTNNYRFMVLSAIFQEKQPL